MSPELAFIPRLVTPVAVASTLVRRGLLVPSLRAAPQLGALALWGFGLAGELRQAAARSPSRAAVIDDVRGQVTYAELLGRARRITALLRQRGLAEGSRVGLLARNHALAVEAMVGISSLGADVVLLNTGLSAHVLSAVVEEQGCDLVIHDDEFAERLGRMRSGCALLPEAELEQALAELPEVTAERPPRRVGRAIVLTSGTTGHPKGAARRTPAGFGPMVSILDRIPLNVGERVLISAPLFHTWGYAALQLTIGLRGTVVLQRQFDAAAAREALSEHQASAMFPVPAMLQRMMHLPPDPRREERLGTLRVVATSGSALPGGFAPAFMDDYGDVLYNLYGSTEASWVAIATPAELRAHPDTSGRPPLGTRVAILDEEGHAVPEGEIGRVFCGNELVFEGYTSGATREFADGMVSTGDLGSVRDGLLYLGGREDDMVVSGGENVYPSEVESTLEHHPAIREVAVVGVPDEDFGARLAAYVVLHPEAQLSEDDVRDHVRAQRARHCVPRDVVFVEELPRNATGKVLKQDLRPR
ncbi:MAG: AMP-binding protein [Micrococcales bacterium]|nr:AMP-binding protein [Micrococcales bacterium]